MIITCDQLFDGRRFLPAHRLVINGDRIETIEPLHSAGASRPDAHAICVMPGLVDSHAHVFGYREGAPAGRPFEPLQTFLEVQLDAGVTAVRDMGGTIEVLSYIRAWAHDELGVSVAGSGPVLDAPPLTWSYSRVIRSEVDVAVQIDCLVVEGVDFIRAYRNLGPDPLRAVIDGAARHTRAVAVYPETTGAIEAATLGAGSVEHVANLVEPDWPGTGGSRPRTVLDRLLAWARVDPGGALVQRTIDALVEHGTALCPTILAARRLVFLTEAINEPSLDLLLPVMPYHRYFKEMRGPFGYAMGRRYLTARLPYPRLDRATEAEARRGAEHMAQFVVHAERAGVRLVAGSDSPTPSVVPGVGLLRELQLWVDAGVPLHAALVAATGAASAVHRGQVGVIEAGAPAALLLLDHVPAGNMLRIASPSTRIFCGGRFVDRQALRDRHAMSVEALA